MADASFDVVSKVDRQEIDNALNQAGGGTGEEYKNGGRRSRSPGTRPAQRKG